MRERKDGEMRSYGEEQHEEQNEKETRGKGESCNGSRKQTDKDDRDIVIA